MNEYLQALWWVVLMFICQRADSEDIHVKRYGTDWKYPFWRYELEHPATPWTLDISKRSSNANPK